MKNGKQQKGSVSAGIKAGLGPQEPGVKTGRHASLPTYGVMALFAMLAAAATLRTLRVETMAGAFFITYLLMVVFYRDIVRYKPKYLASAKKLVLLGILLSGTLLTARLWEFVLLGMSRGMGIPSGSIMYALPVAAGAMMAMLLFDSHTAIMFSFIVSILAGMSLRESPFAVYAFMGSLTAAFSVIRCRKRTEVLRGGAYLAAVNIITALFIMLFEGRISPERTVYAILFASMSAVSVIAIVSVVLPMLEYLFGIMTDISLLELLDLEHPLMKTMMIAAPGTYHHSIIVGNLVEAAAEDVAVNPLLARVSAYYHDIGKIKMPDYFIENQGGGASRHERLTPHMSSMVLISHVKEGVDLAKQYKLPETVTDIIEQHHGTSLITYFYQKAREKNEDLTEDEYRYPGPRPQSKVAALVMMADAVEAASRVLADPIPARISGLVNKIINHIFLEGQLDNCDLTLKEIQAIKKRFIYILTGILHKRVDYPGFDFTKEGAGAGTDIQPAKTDTLRYPPDKEGQPQPASSLRAYRN